ncbi:MAG TPA: HNH endonuclease signature motif containing protein [Baekduia sp.]|nr:HNH endonuclease signature motif containing protein [Baekduia sp.]
MSKSTVAYHVRTLGHPGDQKFRRRYDWAAVQRFYDEGNSITDCQREFGFSRQTWNAARKRGDVMSRPQATPIAELLVLRDVKGNRWNLKRRLIALGLKEDRCELCGLVDWRGQPLPLELHHRNGDPCDDRLENLQIVCPNCHSQTDTWGGKAKRLRALRSTADPA